MSEETPSHDNRQNGVKLMRDKVLLILKKNNNAAGKDNTNQSPVGSEPISERQTDDGKATIVPSHHGGIDRISELENHVIELHRQFDKFVLDSDKFLNQERFMELKRDYDGRLKTLDNLEKSLDESRKQIIKDATYMDEIVQGFSYVKNKIDMLEKRMNEIEMAAKRGYMAEGRVHADDGKASKQMTINSGLTAGKQEYSSTGQGMEQDNKSDINNNISKLKGLCNEI